ncbi:glycosyltransferase [Pedobacter sp. SD-b]|uniref:Glycosyltransferase n=1 Tax=Pedobacter segetis TaxID=2793069 RepID=A0ABS1BMG7_9SPHI|nr:glycosyltransferase family 2 protein [Pedobacter segetis]MBK0384094.1 glycosyltransferase [Pedobacter segetis]
MPSLSSKKVINPKISIIIAVYNAEEELEQSLISIITQNYKNYELIIVDGGSTDSTLNIIKKYYSNINILISEPDTGVYDAMNKGVKKSKGDWIFFLGAGDILLNVLDSLVANFISDNTIYYGNVFRNDLLKIYNGKYPSYKLAVTNICHQAIFYPAIVFKNSEFNTKYKIQADHDFNMRCFGNKNIKFKYLPFLVSIYQGGGYSAKNADYNFFSDKLSIIKKNFPYHIYIYTTIRTFIAQKIIKKNHY